MIEIISRDGLRSRFHVIRNDQRLHMILEQDCYAKEQPIIVSDDLYRITFTLENRSGRSHNSCLLLAGLPEGNYSVSVSDCMITSIRGGMTKQTIMIPVGDFIPTQVSIMRLNNTAENQAW
jgi:hypothetical protein